MVVLFYILVDPYITHIERNHLIIRIRRLIKRRYNMFVSVSVEKLKFIAIKASRQK